MSIRLFAAAALVIASLAACTSSNYGSSGTGTGGPAATRATDSGFNANSYGYGDRYYQLGHD